MNKRWFTVEDAIICYVCVCKGMYGSIMMLICLILHYLCLRQQYNITFSVSNVSCHTLNNFYHHGSGICG